MGKAGIIVLLYFFSQLSLAANDPVIVTAKDKPHGEFSIYVNNTSQSDITISIDLELTNMKVIGGLQPYYVVPKKRHLRVVSGKIIRNGRWSYNYKYHYKWGNPNARHEDGYIYALPLKPGTSAKILQGYNGKFSHTGSEKYSVDWDVPRGTEVYAARGGIVVQVIEEFSKPGRSIEFKNKGNIVIIAHSDGTIANYVHFKKDGVVVDYGQKVRTGQLIGYSGNTGFSTRPHLHLDVNNPIDGNNRQTIPVVYRTARGNLAELKQDEIYTAVR